MDLYQLISSTINIKRLQEKHKLNFSLLFVIANISNDKRIKTLYFR